MAYLRGHDQADARAVARRARDAGRDPTAGRERMRVTDRSATAAPGRAWLRLYPRAWRDRYADELLGVLASRPSTLRTRLDLARGALDAHVHRSCRRHRRSRPRWSREWRGWWPGSRLAPAADARLAWLPARDASRRCHRGSRGGRAVARTARRSGRRRRAGRPSRSRSRWSATRVDRRTRLRSLGGPYGAITGASGAIAAVGTDLVGVVRARAGDHPTAERLVVIGGAMLDPVVGRPGSSRAVAWVGLALTGTPAPRPSAAPDVSRRRVRRRGLAPSSRQGPAADRAHRRRCRARGRARGWCDRS